MYFFVSAVDFLKKNQIILTTTSSSFSNCPYCENKIQNHAHAEHVRKCLGKAFVCHDCGRRFTQKKSLIYHIDNKYCDYTASH